MIFRSYRSIEWLEIVSLLKANGADLSIPDQTGDTLLHRVMRDFPSGSLVERWNEELASALVGCHHPSSWYNPEAEHKKQIEKLTDAYTNHLKYFDFLLNNGINPNTTKDGRSPLHEMLDRVDLSYLEKSYSEVIDKLLAKGYNINSVDSNGDTPLHIAVRRSRVDAVRCLLEKKAEINLANNQGLTPLHLAAAGLPKTTELLIAAGANPHAKDMNNDTPLMYSKKCCQSLSTITERTPYLKAQLILNKKLASQNMTSVASQSLFGSAKQETGTQTKTANPQLPTVDNKTLLRFLSNSF